MSRLLPRELHLSDRPSATAQLVAVWRALELDRPPQRRIVSDDYAPAFLDTRGRTMLRALRLGEPVFHAAERHELAGISAHVLCRHAFIDEHLLTALDDGAEQVVILGAGYDSRAYRFARQLAGRPVFEVDLPPLSRHKAAIVAARPELFGHTAVHRVEIDFRTQTLPDRLAGAGFSTGARTMIVWEGVLPYLDRTAVVDTLGTLAQLCGAGSVLTGDLWDGVGGSGRYAGLRRLAARALSWVGEPVAFGLAPAQARAFFAEQGWTVHDLVESGELAGRYSTDGRPCEKSVYVLAARR